MPEHIQKVLSNVSQGLSSDEQAQARANIGLGALAVKDTAAYDDLSSGVQSSLDKADSAVQDANYVHTDNNFTTAEKDKLAGIEAGAEVNVQADWAQANSSADDFVRNKPANLVQDANYVHTDNNFTTAEKDKLAGIEAGAEVNVQANWNETDSASDSYVQNKPVNLVQDANYVHTDNNYTTADKDKLAGIADGAAVANVSWDSANSKITKTIGSSTTDVVTASTLKTAMALGNVDNTSDATKKTNFTGSIASGNSGFVTGGDAYTALNGKADKVAGATGGNFAGLDANGNLTDSGKKASDFATVAQGSKADSAIQGVQVNGTDLTPDANRKVNVSVPAAANNGTLTITQNGASKGTFGANQSGDTTISLTDTTYESKAAASGGTAVSLVTTGEKYTWNGKQDALPKSGTSYAIDISGYAATAGSAGSATNATTASEYTSNGGIATALGGKVDKVTGKGLSENDFTTTLKNKLDGIASGAEVNQNTFSNVKVGSTTIAADSKTDTLELVAGTGVTLTPDTTNDKVTIAALGNTFIGTYGSTPYNTWFTEYAAGKQLVCRVGPALNGYTFYYLDMLGQQGTDPITFSRIVSNANVTNATQHISTVVCNTDNTYALIGNDVSGTTGTYTNLTVGMAKSVGNTSGSDAVALTTAGLGVTNGTKTVSAGNGVVSASDGFVGDLTGNAATATKATVLQDNTISNKTVGATTSVQSSASNYVAMWVDNTIVPVHTNNFTAYAAHRDAAGNGISTTYQRKDAIGVNNTTWTRNAYVTTSSATVVTTISATLVSSGTIALENLIINTTESGTVSGGSYTPGSVILTISLCDDIDLSTVYDQQIIYVTQAQTLSIPLVVYYSGSSNRTMKVCVKMETTNGYWKGGISGKLLYINR